MKEEALSSSCSEMAESDHRIANHLALLSGYVRLKGSAMKRRNTAPDTADISLLLTAIEVQINAIGRLHRLLAAEESQDSADLGDHLRKICASLRAVAARDVVILEKIGSDCALPMNKIIGAAQIFTEVITNAIKHGHRADSPAVIEVSCWKDPDESIVIEVSDNGPGLPDNDIPNSGGLGFQLVQTLVAQIGATIEFLSKDQGLNVRLTVSAVRAPVADFAEATPVAPTRSTEAVGVNTDG